MRSFSRNIFLQIAGKFKKPSNSVHILNGHYISKLNSGNDRDIFSKQLRILSKYVDYVNVDEALEMILNKVKVKRPTVTFTFDDGFKDCYTDIAPVLNDYNVNALFFINPGYIEGSKKYIKNFNDNIVLSEGKEPMTYDQVKELSDNNFVIGNHTYNHIRLSDFDNIDSEVLDSKNKIESLTKKKCNHFAWTYGQVPDIREEQIEFILKHHEYIYSGCDYQNYFLNNNPKIINRRHFEGNWPVSYMKYFLSKQRVYL